MSDGELLQLRVRVQRALQAMSKPRTERDATELREALCAVEQALGRLDPARA